MKKRRILISIFGVDGSGKTTQCKILYESLLRDGYRVAYVWSRREPFLLKPLIKFVKKAILCEKAKIEGEEYEEIVRKRHTLFSNALVRKIWFFVSLLEYRLLLSRKVFRRHKNVDILICDRYLPDALVDLATNYNYNGISFCNLLNHPLVNCFPKPTASFFIDVPAETGAARKTDGTSAAYLKERVALYRSVAAEIKAVTVNGNEPIETIADKIQAAIFARIQGGT